MTTPNQYYQHQDGGLYQVVDIATSTVDGVQQLVIYKHIYPFEQRLWARPMIEWTAKRFNQITETSARMFEMQDREQTKQWISDRKAKRKAQEQAIQDEIYRVDYDKDGHPVGDYPNL